MTLSETHILTGLATSISGLSIAEMWKAEPWWLKINLLSGGLIVAVDRLERAGKIKGEWVEGPYPRRRIYHLSPGQ